MREIPIQDFSPLRIGQTEDAAAGTGCTVFLCPEGMRAGMDVRGGGPASRETLLLDPLMAAREIHAVLLAGGSAFGMNAAGGVMAYLEEQSIGLDVGVTRVPLVVQADLFDLPVGDPFRRPDAAMGRAAAKCALEAPNYRDGSFGAGCGATVGKLRGMEYCMKSGMGSFAVELGELKIGAVAAVNALGDVFDWRTGRQLAGLLGPDRRTLSSSTEALLEGVNQAGYRFGENTTLGVVVTNAAFDKASLCKLAGMAQDGLARSIRPVHTDLDGDTVFALSVGKVKADRVLVGTLAAEVLSEAVARAVRKADSAYGIPSAKELFPE